MIWLALHMWFLLLLAFLLGLLLGWWIWRKVRVETVVKTETVYVEVPAAPLATEAVEAPTKPRLYVDGPTDGPADDLKKIKGIGPKYEALLNKTGIYYFRQITDWTAEEIAWLDEKLEFPGRIARENWQAQATVLRDGGTTEFADRYGKGETPSSYKDDDPRKKDQ